MIIKYDSIKAEYKRLGITNKQVADILGISVQALDKRIKGDKPTIHLITYALANYYSNNEANLTEVAINE
jgi:transcriptional regulator with XRE-family HTH domain